MVTLAENDLEGAPQAGERCVHPLLAMWPLQAGGEGVPGLGEGTSGDTHHWILTSV